MRKTSFFIFSTISLILIVGLVFFDRIKENFSSRLVLAQVISLEGGASVQGARSPGWQALQLKDYIRDADLVKTDFESELTLKIPPSAQLKIMPNSQFFLKKEVGKNLLNLQSGALEVLVKPAAGSLWIAENGERIDASLYNEKKQARLSIDAELILPLTTISEEVLTEQKNDLVLETKDVPTVSPPLSVTNKSVLQTALRNKVLSQNNFFYRCYSSLLQNEPNKKGKVIISFQVENRGSISHTEVVHSDFKNPDFLSCLREVIRRTQFESFAGDPIVTQIPLVFETQK